MKILGNVFLKKKKRSERTKKGKKLAELKKTPQRTKYKQRTSRKLKQTKFVLPKTLKKKKKQERNCQS